MTRVENVTCNNVIYSLNLL